YRPARARRPAPTKTAVYGRCPGPLDPGPGSWAPGSWALDPGPGSWPWILGPGRLALGSTLNCGPWALLSTITRVRSRSPTPCARCGRSVRAVTCRRIAGTALGAKQTRWPGTQRTLVRLASLSEPKGDFDRGSSA